MAPAGQVVKDFTIARINLIPGAHAIVQRIRQGAPLILARDPTDKYDPNAIMVIIAQPPASKRKIGYLPPGLAKELAPLMDAGLNIIARKAPNPLYGVCQVAYIPPPPTEAAPAVEPVKPLDPVELKVPADTPVTVELPEEVAQEDLDTATELPPLGDSRRPDSDPAAIARKRAQDFADRTGVSIPDMKIEPKNYRGDGRRPRTRKDDSDD
jgi:hypothetical protein